MGTSTSMFPSLTRRKDNAFSSSVRLFWTFDENASPIRRVKLGNIGVDVPKDDLWSCLEVLFEPSMLSSTTLRGGRWATGRQAGRQTDTPPPPLSPHHSTPPTVGDKDGGLKEDLEAPPQVVTGHLHSDVPQLDPADGPVLVVLVLVLVWLVLLGVGWGWGEQ